MADSGLVEEYWPQLPALLAYLEQLTSKVWTVQMASTGGGAAPAQQQAAAQPQAAPAQAARPASASPVPNLSWLAFI